MPDRDDPPPQATVKHAAAVDGDLSGASARSAEASRESYHEEGGGADPGGRSLGRKDPTTTGENARDKDNVQIR